MNRTIRTIATAAVALPLTIGTGSTVFAQTSAPAQKQRDNFCDKNPGTCLGAGLAALIIGATIFGGPRNTEAKPNSDQRSFTERLRPSNCPPPHLTTRTDCW